MGTKSSVFRVMLQLFLLSLVWGASVVNSVANDCDHVIEKDEKLVDARNGYQDVQPGDTVCLAAGTRDSLRLLNFQGTAEEPIVFKNVGGQVVINTSSNHGILIENSRFWRLTGTGVNDITYGIKIEKTSNRGVAAIFKSSDMEIDHLEITNIGGVGIGLKTQAVCSDGSTDDWQAYDYDGDGRLGNDLDDVVNRANFVQFNTVVHDNYIHNVGSEGIYAGSSFYQGQEFDCDSGTEIIYDPLLIGVSIYNNIVDGSGLDGIQAGSAVEDCGIHHNRIYRDSLRDANNEQSGIMNNKGSACHIYNNYIQDGGGPGIFLQGIGGHRVYNNILINVGANFAGEDKGGNGIFISQNGVGSGQDMYVFNNTIVNPQHYGIVFNDDDSAASKIQNNIVINPGNLSDYGDDAYIQIWKRKNVIVSNNLHAENPSDLKFSSPANFDYTLTENSAAIDSGVNLISDCVFTDYNDERRPQGKGFDIGAYEYQDRASGEMSELTTVDVQPRLFLPLLIADIQSACP